MWTKLDAYDKTTVGMRTLAADSCCGASPYLKFESSHENTMGTDGR